MPVNFATLGIATCAVSFGKESSFAGVLANVSIKVVAKAIGVPSLRLTWAASNDVFSSFTDSSAGDPGAPGTITLPQTGQTGFKHGTATFKDWYYEAVVSADLADGQHLDRTYRFQIPAGQTTLDLDTLDEDTPVTAQPAVGQFSAEPAGLSSQTQAALLTTYLPLRFRSTLLAGPRPASASQGTTKAWVTTTGGMIRPTERNARGLWITTVDATVQYALGTLDSTATPSAGAYTAIAAGATVFINSNLPVWLKTSSGTSTVVVDQEALAA